MDFDFNWLDEKGISTKDGIEYTGGSEKYISAMQRFFKGYEQNSRTIEELLAAGDIEGYEMKVHSLKSNSRMIGAGELGNAFEELELAAGRKDIALITEKTPAALLAYKNIIEIIRPVGEMSAIKVAGELSAEEAIKTAEELLDALENYEDDLSGELAGILRGYPFRLTQREKLKEAISMIEDFMYDEAAELIRQILPSIE